MNEVLTLKKLSDTEFWIGPTQIRLTEGYLIDIKAAGPQNYDTAIAQVNLFHEIYQETNKPLTYLVDLNDSGKNSPEARKIWKEVSESEHTSKIALVGVHPVARVIAGFVMSASASTKIQFFSTREKALKWIYG